jgi:hypothetical protein
MKSAALFAPACASSEHPAQRLGLRAQPANDGANGSALLTAALHYAARGWRVFPLVPKRKAPMTEHGCHDATTDPGVILRWWSDHPDANIGIATGARSRLLVADVDTYKVPNALEALERDCGPLPKTYTVAIPRGGRHLYFALGARQEARCTAAVDGVCLKGACGYVIAPPSMTCDGQYAVTDARKPAKAPASLCKQPETPQRQTPPRSSNPSRAPEHCSERMTSDDSERPAKPLRLRAQPAATGANPLAVLSWQPRRADAVLTRGEWTALCQHLHNGNGIKHFVMGFRDSDGVKQYKRSKRWTVDRAISWAWSSIAGSPKSKLAFVPYASNERQQSRWGGMDFDAHNSMTIFGKSRSGESDRARELALAAFRVLLNAPDLAVILETSGSGGWHVWAISPDFHDTREWIRLLKSVAATIGTPIADGVCEIFPPDSLPSRFGKGMRAPGCWNPGTETCSQIVWENVHTSLESVLSGKSKIAPLNCKGLEAHFPDTKKKASFPVSTYREAELLQRLGITALRTRNGKLAGLVGEVFHQVGRDMAQRLAQAQFRSKTVATKASEAEHLESFDKLWAGLAEKWAATLSATEREIFTRLETENERDAFRIVRSYAGKADQDGAVDFPIARDNLGERLGVTGNGAAGIRNKLAKLGAIEKTADYVPNKFAARFRWLPDGQEPEQEASIPFNNT